MSDNLWERAEELANRPYDITIEEDTLSDGRKIFLARHPQLRGCVAQGETINEATSNLDDARVDYIYALLDMRLDVPAPLSSKPSVAYQQNTYIFDASGQADALENKKHVLSIRLQGDSIQHH